jgi:hypothetical protein
VDQRVWSVLGPLVGVQAWHWPVYHALYLRWACLMIMMARRQSRSWLHARFGVIGHMTVTWAGAPAIKCIRDAPS